MWTMTGHLVAYGGEGAKPEPAKPKPTEKPKDQPKSDPKPDPKP